MDEEEARADREASEVPSAEECPVRARLRLKVAWTGLRFFLVAILIYLVPLEEGRAALHGHPVARRLILGVSVLAAWLCLSAMSPLQRAAGHVHVREDRLRAMSRLCLWWAIAIVWGAVIIAIQIGLDQYPQPPPDLWWGLRLVGAVPVLVLWVLFMGGLVRDLARRAEARGGAE